MNEPWRLTLFGGLSARQGERTITRFKSQKIASLLAFLAAHPRQTHSREALIELLWPEVTLEAGRNSLSVALSSLRHQFEPPGTPANSVIRADRFSVGLNPIAVITDVQEFEEAVSESSRAQSDREREGHLLRAADLYAGKLLPHLYDEWIAGEAERLAELYFDAAARLIGSLESRGEVESALAYARRAVALEPLREDAQHTLIRLLDAAGQPGSALRQYREFERLLDEEMADEPSAPLRALARQIEKRSGLATAAVPAPVPLPPLPKPTAPRPSGTHGPVTVTFLMTDIEGSTRGWKKSGDAYREALQQHHRLLRAEFARHGGQEVSEAGDGFVVAFAAAAPALRCAVAAQHALTAHAWPSEAGTVRVRMALHTGDVEQSESGEYQGLPLHKASRILSAAHGGQIVLSEITAGLLRRDLEGDAVRLVDLGVYRLRDLPAPERLFQAEGGDGSDGPPASFPPPRADAGYAAAGLPLTFTRFFGREGELSQLHDLLRQGQAGQAGQVRLVTLTGLGGTGKTRVAIEAARAASESFGGAAWFVPLADIADPALIAGAILGSLRVPRSPQQEPLDQVAEALNKQPSSLLVLDNYEQLVENGGADVVQTLLERVPTLTLLVTSRQLLGLSAEREFVLSPLPTPNGDENAEHLSAFDSVQLFIDRAQQVKTDFQVTNTNAAAVAELVSRLEGIPLAIELAAARALVLTPSQMLAQLADRFTFLSGRKRDVVERHRTLRAAVDWSFRLLSPELRRFFTRLSVFRGGWTAEAAEVVCEEPLALDYLAQLHECSLVLSEETDQGMRFAMLETLREFGEEHLVEGERVLFQQRHGAFFSSWVEERYALLTSPDPVVVRQSCDQCALEQDNLRAALRWAETLPDAGEIGLNLVKPLRFYWSAGHFYTEGRLWLRTFLQRSADAPPGLPRRMIVNFAGLLATKQGDYAESISLYEENIRYYRESGVRDIAFISSLTFLSGCYSGLGDLKRAEDLCRESLAVARSLKLPSYIGEAARVLAAIYVKSRRLEEAKTLLAESLTLFREHGYHHFLARSLWVRGEAARLEGDFQLAHRCYAEALDILVPGRVERDISWLLNSYAILAQVQGHPERAARLLGAAEAIHEALNIPYRPGELTGDYVVREPVHEAAWTEGYGMTWEEAAVYARNEEADGIPEAKD